MTEQNNTNGAVKVSLYLTSSDGCSGGLLNFADDVQHFLKDDPKHQHVISTLKDKASLIKLTLLTDTTFAGATKSNLINNKDSHLISLVVVTPHNYADLVAEISQVDDSVLPQASNDMYPRVFFITKQDLTPLHDIKFHAWFAVAQFMKRFPDANINYAATKPQALTLLSNMKDSMALVTPTRDANDVDTLLSHLRLNHDQSTPHIHTSPTPVSTLPVLHYMDASPLVERVTEVISRLHRHAYTHTHTGEEGVDKTIITHPRAFVDHPADPLDVFPLTSFSRFPVLPGSPPYLWPLFSVDLVVQQMTKHMHLPLDVTASISTALVEKLTQSSSMSSSQRQLLKHQHLPSVADVIAVLNAHGEEFVEFLCFPRTGHEVMMWVLLHCDHMFPLVPPHLIAYYDSCLHMSTDLDNLRGEAHEDVVRGSAHVGDDDDEFESFRHKPSTHSSSSLSSSSGATDSHNYVYHNAATVICEALSHFILVTSSLHLDPPSLSITVPHELVSASDVGIDADRHNRTHHADSVVSADASVPLVVTDTDFLSHAEMNPSLLSSALHAMYTVPLPEGHKPSLEWHQAQLASREDAVGQVSTRINPTLPPPRFDLYCHYQQLPLNVYGASIASSFDIPVQTDDHQCICHCQDEVPHSWSALQHQHHIGADHVVLHQSYDVYNSLFLPKCCPSETCRVFHLGLFYTHLPSQLFPLPVKPVGTTKGDTRSSDKSANAGPIAVDQEEDFMMGLLFGDDEDDPRVKPEPSQTTTAEDTEPVAAQGEEQPIDPSSNDAVAKMRFGDDHFDPEDNESKSCHDVSLPAPGDVLLYGLSQMMLDQEFFIWDIDIE